MKVNFIIEKSNINIIVIVKIVTGYIKKNIKGYGEKGEDNGRLYRLVNK